MYTFAVFVYAMLSIKSLVKTQFNNGKENPILTILTGKKLCFIQFSTRTAASDLFHLFTQSIGFYTFHYHILKSADVEKDDSSNRQQKWMVAPLGKIYGKIWVGFVLIMEDAFS